MSGKQLHRQDRDHATAERAVLFIEQKPESFKRENIRATASHARRWQTKRKHEERRDEAQRRAVYARGLVGWQNRSSSPAEKESRSSIGSNVVIPKDFEPQYGQDRPVEMPWQVSGGLRSDPFDSLPSPKSREVMQMVDYYVHVWSPLKSGAFDAMIGCNTQLDLCWPYALQSNMLFNASLAVSRVAWCLMQAMSVANDQLVLQHRGVAMNQMRELLSSPDHSSEVELIFTIGRMLSITYMSNEPVSFQIHLQAFQRIAGRYITAHPDSDLASVIKNRLVSWTALQAFREGWDPLNDRESCSTGTPGSSHGREAVLMTDTASEQDATTALAESLAPISLTPEVLKVLRPITEALQSLGESKSPSDRKRHTLVLTSVCRSLEKVLRQPKLPGLDSQFCCGLFAFCLQMRYLVDAEAKSTDTRMVDDGSNRSFDSSESQLPVPSTSYLNDIAQSFINKRLAQGLQSLRHKSCIAWSAIVLGSYLLQSLDNGLRTKGHIILISVRESIMAECPLRNTEFGYDALKSEIAANVDVLWCGGLEGVWEQSWHSTMTRQHSWEEHGLLKIGIPVAYTNIGDTKIDLVEYLVLREARDSLPKIEEPEYVV